MKQKIDLSIKNPKFLFLQTIGYLIGLLLRLRIKKIIEKNRVLNQRFLEKIL
jgi:hypothetical protein